MQMLVKHNIDKAELSCLNFKVKTCLCVYIQFGLSTNPVDKQLGSLKLLKVGLLAYTSNSHCAFPGF